MATANLRNSNVMHDGLRLDTTFTNDDLIRTSVSKNDRFRSKTSFYCDASVDGTWDIYDIVWDTGKMSLLQSIDITGDTLSIYTHNHIGEAFLCDFTPDSDPAGTETLLIRIMHGGPGV